MTLTDDPLQQFQFFVVKGINRLKKEEPAAARPSKEVELLTEIRDLLAVQMITHNP